MPGNHTRSTWPSVDRRPGLFASNSATSLSSELSSEILGYELDTGHLPESLQPGAGINTQDKGKDRVQRITHVVGLAQCAVSKPVVQGTVPSCSCLQPPGETRVCAGDRWAVGAGIMGQCKIWILVKVERTIRGPLQGAGYFIPALQRKSQTLSRTKQENIRVAFLRG